MARSPRRGVPAKVLYFTDNPGFGGMEKMILTTLAGLDRALWEPVLVHRPGAGFEQLDEAVRNLAVRIWVVPQMKAKRDATWVLAVAREFRAEGTAVFHVHRSAPSGCFYPLLTAVIARVPAIVVTQHLFVERNARYVRDKLLSAGIDRYIGVSEEMARKLRPRCLSPERQVQVIHNGILLARFSRPVNPALLAVLTKGNQRPVVLSVSRLDDKQKGLRFLVSAAALVPEAQFVFAGDGPDRASLEAQARSIGVEERVTFLGHREDVPDLMASCDVFVMPSLYEGFGVSALEAMASAKPVVASSIRGLDEVVVHGETGLLVPPRDPAALAQAIRTVLSNKALAQRLGTAGRAQAHREFSVETMIQRTTTVYEEILSSKQTRPETR